MVELPVNKHSDRDRSDTDLAPSDDAEDNKIIAALAYIWIASLVVLLAKKDSPYAQFHARQAFVLFLISVAILFVASFIPFVSILNFVVLAFFVWGLVAAWQGKRTRLPMVADFAEKLNL